VISGLQRAKLKDMFARINDVPVFADGPLVIIIYQRDCVAVIERHIDLAASPILPEPDGDDAIGPRLQSLFLLPSFTGANHNRVSLGVWNLKVS